MLGSPDLIDTVAQAIDGFKGPIVLDPVMLSKSGVALLPDDVVGALVSILVPHATVVTPNLPEAARSPEGKTQALTRPRLLRGVRYSTWAQRLSR